VVAVIAPALMCAAIALPWLILLPLGGITGVLATAFTVVSAFHGAGLVIARLARLARSGERAADPRASPWLILQWGVAAMIGLSGLAIAFQVGTLVSHAVLVFGFAAVHTAALGVRFGRGTARIAECLAGPRAWLIPAALLAALGTLTVLGAAGEPLARPFDDDGHVLAQLRRVLDTGALGDSIGYPRSWQLGAQIALAAVGSGAGDGFARAIEPLAQILALGLAVSRIVHLGRVGDRDPSSAPWAVLLIAAAYAAVMAPADPLPCWTAVGLSVALYTMLSEREPAPALPLAITAGALVALRYELAPIAAVAVIAAGWQRRDAIRTAILIAGVFAVAFPFLVARMLAWRAVPPLAHAELAAPAQSALVLRALLATAIAVPSACVLRLILPESPSFRLAATATAAALGGLVAHLTGAGPHSMRLAWPIAIAFAITVVIELARSQPPRDTSPHGEPLARVPADGNRARWLGLRPAALIAALVLCLIIHEGREAPGELRWSRRMAAAATGIEHLQRPAGTATAPYAAVLASAPPGATVAVWVSEPERLDYARHDIVDLRTPAGAHLRDFRWAAHASGVAPLLAQLSAAYLLIEADDMPVRRAQTDLLYRFACQRPLPACADDLEAIALGHPEVARRGNVRLIDLRR
jgi:hypothetical protein